MNNTTVVELTEFIGKTLKSVNVINDEYNIKIIFEFDTGQKYKMYHEQFCCADVYIEDITGNMQNLIDRELIMAEQVQECGENEHGTFTWTFYKLATSLGYVTIRWYGESNGYYSEEVWIEEIYEGGITW